MLGEGFAGSPRPLLLAVLSALSGGITLVIGIQRVLAGDDRGPNPLFLWLLIIAFVLPLSILFDRRLPRRDRVRRAVLRRPLPPLTDYRPKPDPRRTRRQRFIEWFDPDIDRSDERLDYRSPSGIASVLGNVLFDTVAFALPLVVVRWLDPEAIAVCIMGAYWLWLGAAGAIRVELDARAQGPAERAAG